MASMQKRKRESTDIAEPRPAPPMSAVDHDFDQSYLHADDEAMESGEVDFDAAFGNHPEQETAVEEQQGGEHQHQHQHLAHPQQGEVAAASNTAAAAMAQYHTMTVPQSTTESFMTGQQGEGNGQPEPPAGEQSGPSAQRTSSFSNLDNSAMQTTPNEGNGGDASPGQNPSLTPGQGKPPVGTDEWHKIRKDNHKEVERRRRETINEGINELAKIVPGCEKNKGSILSRAVQFITQLKENETQNIEKWTLEKLLTEQAIAELSSSVDKLKAECQGAWTECETWKRMAEKAGMSGQDGGKDAEGEEEQG